MTERDDDGGGRERVHVFVSGRVQGVTYRASTREAARERGLTGWARNLDDGRVEAVFEGSPDAVASIVEWCQDGPPRADVTAVETEPEDPEGLSRFNVRW